MLTHTHEGKAQEHIKILVSCPISLVHKFIKLDNAIIYLHCRISSSNFNIKLSVCWRLLFFETTIQNITFFITLENIKICWHCLIHWSDIVHLQRKSMFPILQKYQVYQCQGYKFYYHYEITYISQTVQRINESRMSLTC